jgi:hypothetical protein
MDASCIWLTALITQARGRTADPLRVGGHKAVACNVPDKTNRPIFSGCLVAPTSSSTPDRGGQPKIVKKVDSQCRVIYHSDGRKKHEVSSVLRR